MTKPIYKLFMFKNIEAYHQLSSEERDKIFSKLESAFEKAGRKRLCFCDSSWSSEQWPVFGVEVFPNTEAVQQYAEALNELQLSRYVESTTLLGTEVD